MIVGLCFLFVFICCISAVLFKTSKTASDFIQPVLILILAIISSAIIILSRTNHY